MSPGGENAALYSKIRVAQSVDSNPPHCSLKECGATVIPLSRQARQEGAFREVGETRTGVIDEADTSFINIIKLPPRTNKI